MTFSWTSFWFLSEINLSLRNKFCWSSQTDCLGDVDKALIGEWWLVPQLMWWKRTQEVGVRTIPLADVFASLKEDLSRLQPAHFLCFELCRNCVIIMTIVWNFVVVVAYLCLIPFWDQLIWIFFIDRQWFKLPVLLGRVTIEFANSWAWF